MNTQPRNKILIIIIAILLIANIATLSFFLMKKSNHTRSGRADKKEQVTAFLKKEVGFTDDQLKSYEALSSEHREKMKMNFDAKAAGRESIFKNLASQSFSDSAIENASNAISIDQKEFELKMLQHLKEIRNICTPVQLPVFDSGFYRIIAKRGESRKNKRK